MLPVVIGFCAAGLLLATMGFLIRRGYTFLLAGYDANQVADERGLARFCGNRFLLMGAIALLAGLLVFVLPENLTFLAAALFLTNALVGSFTIVWGAQRFAKRAP